MKAKIYYNPLCSTCQETLKLLKDKGYDCEVIDYMKAPLKKNEIMKLLNILKIDALDLLRRKGEIYDSLIKKYGEPSSKQALGWMAKSSELIQRPIVVIGDKAIVARPPEKVLELIG